MTLLGVHFFTPGPGGGMYDKPWQIATQKTLPITDVAWCQNAYSGHGIDNVIDRVTYQADWLWQQGISVIPIIRLDRQPGDTIRNDAVYRDGADYLMRRWGSRSRPRLLVVCGNEFQIEGNPSPVEVAQATSWVAADAYVNSYNCDVLAGAVAPHNCGANPQPFYPGNSAEWLNWQYALGKALQGEGANIKGYALHAYGDRVVNGYWDSEATTDYYHPDRPGCRQGFRVWRDLMDVADAAWYVPGREFHVTECNTHWPWERWSSENYCAGWLQKVMADLSTRPRVKTASWFVGDNSGWRHDSLTDREGAGNPGGGCAAADDDALRIWGMM
jgi:hypothetical protein